MTKRPKNYNYKQIVEMMVEYYDENSLRADWHKRYGLFLSQLIDIAREKLKVYSKLRRIGDR